MAILPSNKLNFSLSFIILGVGILYINCAGFTRAPNPCQNNYDPSYPCDGYYGNRYNNQYEQNRLLRNQNNLFRNQNSRHFYSPNGRQNHNPTYIPKQRFRNVTRPSKWKL